MQEAVSMPCQRGGEHGEIDIRTRDKVWLCVKSRIRELPPPASDSKPEMEELNEADYFTEKPNADATAPSMSGIC